eukprot:gene24843-10497_t
MTTGVCEDKGEAKPAESAAIPPLQLPGVGGAVAAGITAGVSGDTEEAKPAEGAATPAPGATDTVGDAVAAGVTAGFSGDTEETKPAEDAATPAPAPLAGGLDTDKITNATSDAVHSVVDGFKIGPT